MKQLYKWPADKFYIYLLHLFFWMLLILPLFINNGDARFSNLMKYRILISNLALIVLFYWNAYLLVPKLYELKKRLLYIFSVAISAVFLMYGSFYLGNVLVPHDKAFPHKVFDRTMAPPSENRGPNFFQFPLFLSVVAISFSYRLIGVQNRREKIRKKQETEILKTELILLRSQISPHFMFNVLNSMVSLARKKSDLLEPSLIQLSNLMRYVLYDNSHNRILLSEELAYLKSYIELQSLRFGDDVRLDIHISSYAGNGQIEPMLLIPFVENAFKHGIGELDDPYISIRITADPTDNRLCMRVENLIPAGTQTKDDSPGIGLSNVIRRLELLYPGQHMLTARAVGDKFITDLTLEL